MAVHAKNAYIAIGTAGSETDISGKGNDGSLSFKVDAVDVTVFGLGAKAYIAGLKDGTVKLGGLWDSTSDGLLAPLLGADGTSIIVGPAGNTAGMVKYSALGFLTSYNPGVKVGDAVTWDGDFQMSGGWNVGVFS